MNANYKKKANYWSKNERRVMGAITKQMVEENLEDVSKRVQYMYSLSMLEIGLKPSTVTKVLKKLPEITALYEHYKTDQLGDYVLHERLEAQGVEIGMTEHEL